MIKGLTPIPYKLMTITAGFVSMNLATFIIASIAGRGLIFMTVGVLFRLFGAKSMSLPWSSLEHRGAKHVRFKKTDMWGPAWAFEQPGDQSA